MEMELVHRMKTEKESRARITTLMFQSVTGLKLVTKGNLRTIPVAVQREQALVVTVSLGPASAPRNQMTIVRSERMVIEEMAMSRNRAQN